MTVKRDQQLAGTVMTTLRKVYGRPTVSEHESALEALMFGIINDGETDGKAPAAIRRLLRLFVDWNEVRVSGTHEIADALSGIPDAVEKARVIRAVLNRLLRRTCDLSLEYLRDKSQREGLRLVSGVQGFPESALARAMCLELDHDVMPLTPKVVMICRRLGLLKQGLDQKTTLRRVQAAVSKKQMFEFHSLLSRHAEMTCFENSPTCVECKLADYCAEGKKIVKAAKKTTSAMQTKKKSSPRKSTGTKKTVKKKAVKSKAAKKKPVKRKAAATRKPAKRKSSK